MDPASIPSPGRSRRAGPAVGSCPGSWVVSSWVLPWRCSDRGTVRPRARRGRARRGPPGGRATTATRIAAGVRPARTIVSARAPSAAVPHDWRTNGRSVGRTRIRIRDQEVCCLGQGDSCHNNNDCECCGTLSCHHGRCRVREGTNCAPGKVFHLGACIGNGVCRPDSENQSPCGPAACGQTDFGPSAPIRVLDHSRRGTRVSRGVLRHGYLTSPARRAPTAPRTRCVSLLSGPAPLGLFSGVWPAILLAG